MYRILTKFLAAVAVMFALAATPAAAQATRTWVSGVGDDVNPCSRTAPCKTWAGAISKTAAGGIISVLDPGGFGSVTITKSITLQADGNLGSILASGVTGIIINAAATDRVVIDGLNIDGSGSTLGTVGVRILSAFDVLINNSTIHNFRTGTGAGVSVESTTTARVTIHNSTLNSNNLAVSVTSTGGTGHVKFLDSLALDNFNGGLSVDGAGNDIEIWNSPIVGPVGLIQTNGGVVRSYGGNVIPSATTPAQTAATK